MIREREANRRDAEDAERNELFYLYGIVLPDSAAAVLLRERRLPGIGADAPLFPLEAAGLVAAVSRVPASVFDEEPLNALAADLERLTPYAVRHEAAVRALSGSAVIPMAFGTVYRSSEGVAAVLQEQAAAFRNLLAQFQGRQEWGVKVIADTGRLQQTVERENEALQALAAAAAAASEGRAYLIGRKRDRLLADAAAQLAADSAHDILHHLAKLSASAVEDQRGPSQPGAEHLAGKAAFLVDDAALDAFHRAVEALQRRHQPRGFRIEVSGPWAPYSFVRQQDGSDV
ncbi:MAG: GvpL/GvpF family gas vesicle protein [Dehalococcoidia bacterium]